MILNNRELSWLVFNERVLQEAQDRTAPLMQRLRFLGIFSNNQDEFVKVRVAKQIRLSRGTGAGARAAAALLPQIYSRMADSRQKFDSAYDGILSEMAAIGINVVNEKQLSEEQEKFCLDYYSSVVGERIVPLLIRKRTKMPFLGDGSIYLAVKMTARASKSARYAVIQIPVSSACPRFVELPSPPGSRDIIYLDDIIRLCLKEIFFMFSCESVSAHSFRIVRDAQFEVDGDISKSLMEKAEEGIENRYRGKPVRFIYDRDMPEDLLSLIVSKLSLKDGPSLDPGGRYHLKRDLMKFPHVCPRLEEKLPAPLRHPAIEPFSSLFKVIAAQDVMLHFPYHTFNHVIDFLREAAIDPRVESIFITLYRTAEHSKVINALIGAAKNGKRVTAVIELLARFDEGRNIEYADILQRSGVRVIDGVPGLKVHGKLILAERRERGECRGYAYIGTGNFNEATARIYSDFGLLTRRREIAAETRAVFDSIISHRPLACRELLVAPYNMRSEFESLIDEEIKNAKKGKEAYIKAKFNSLTDPEMIRLLYRASRAGVKISLIVRGVCCLQPGIVGLSENIRVISVVDIYLEHARMVIFCGGGEEKVFILSADWMTRNLNRRVEVGARILEPSIRRQLREVFEIQWHDNVKARDISQFGVNEYVKSEGDESCRSQLALHEYYRRGAERRI
ncbi:MAG: polyphosphate kinase 1 [Synergistaceae bacterium]|nr:polyphosphate kinase 1 [Synergistaceae bacterium]